MATNVHPSTALLPQLQLPKAAGLLHVTTTQSLRLPVRLLLQRETDRKIVFGHSTAPAINPPPAEEMDHSGTQLVMPKVRIFQNDAEI